MKRRVDTSGMLFIAAAKRFNHPRQTTLVTFIGQLPLLYSSNHPSMRPIALAEDACMRP
jgi:hypothetical protein